MTLDKIESFLLDGSMVYNMLIRTSGGDYEQAMEKKVNINQLYSIKDRRESGRCGSSWNGMDRTGLDL